MTRWLGTLQGVLVIGLAVRLLISPFTAHPYDMFGWYDTGEKVLSSIWPTSAFLVPYRYSYFLFVFPATIAFNLLSSVVGSTTISMASVNPILNPGPQWGISVVPGMLYDLLLKLPLIASDSLLALVLYRIVVLQTHDTGRATTVAMLWFLNPLTIWVSAGWGMFDTLPALFSVLTLYLIMKEKFELAGASLAIAAALKFYAIVIYIPALLIVCKIASRRGFTRFTVALIAATTVLFIPLYGSVAYAFLSLVGGPSLPGSLGLNPAVFTGIDPSFGAVVTSTVGGIHFSGVTFWSSITLFTPLPSLTDLSAATILILLGVWYFFVYRLRTPSPEAVTAAMAMPLVILLVCYRVVNVNFLVWVLPFAAILVATFPGPRKAYWFLAFVGFVASITISLLPYYLLPISPWVGGQLAWVLSSLGAYRVATSSGIAEGISVGKLVLALLGLSISGILLYLSRSWFGLVRGGSD